MIGGIKIVNQTEQLKNQVKELEEVLKKLDKQLFYLRNMQGITIRICKQKSGYQYYKTNDNGKRVYIKHKDKEIVRKAFQKSYYECVRKEILTQKYQIERFLKFYNPTAIEDVYDKLCDARKELVTPIICTDDDYIEKWRQTHPGEKNTFPIDGQFVTDNGEYVRSKSEKILADLFLKMDIPYIYEPEVELSNGHKACPDFLVLNKRTRKSYYWEHFGRVDAEEYAIRNFPKIYAYEKIGLIQGKNLIISMETEKQPLDLNLVKEKIEMYLM